MKFFIFEHVQHLVGRFVSPSTFFIKLFIYMLTFIFCRNWGEFVLGGCGVMVGSSDGESPTMIPLEEDPLPLPFPSHSMRNGEGEW